MKEVDIKETTDNWRPWRRPNDSEKVDGKIKRTSSRWDSLASKMGMETKKTVGGKSHILDNARPPRVHVEGDDVEMRDPKAAVLKMLRKPQKETWSESEDREGDGREQNEMAEPNSAVLERVERPEEELGSESLESVEQVLPPDLKERIRKKWTKALLKRLENKRYGGCAYKGWLGQWHPTEKLLREIAEVIKRKYDDDMTDSLWKYLVKVIAVYCKENGYSNIFFIFHSVNIRA